MALHYDRCAKIVLIGDSGVGKSSLVLRFADDTFSESHMSTIGVDFRVRNIQSEDGKVTRLHIWDTAGQERFRTITTSYYRGSQGVVIVYDVTKRSSFESVAGWLHDIRQSMPDDVPLLLVGNKSDLVTQRQVSWAEGLACAATFDAAFLESSAKCGHQVDECFERMAEASLKRLERLERHHQPAGKQKVPMCTQISPDGAYTLTWVRSMCTIM